MNCMSQNNKKNHPSEDSTQAQTVRDSQDLLAQNGSMFWAGHHSPEQGREARGGEMMMGDVEDMRNGSESQSWPGERCRDRSRLGAKAGSSTQHWGPAGPGIPSPQLRSDMPDTELSSNYPIFRIAG